MNFKRNLSAGLSGFVFAVGLGVAGMTDPKVIQGFFDVFGTWNPALLFVMGGALVVHMPVVHWTQSMIRQNQAPFWDERWNLPAKKRVTRSLIVGGGLFGMGWGAAGYCPGPAVVSLASFQLEPAVFVLAMLAGMSSMRIAGPKMQGWLGAEP